MTSPRSSSPSLPPEHAVFRRKIASFGPFLCACVCGPDAPLAHELTVRDLDGVVYVQPGGDGQRLQSFPAGVDNANREVTAELMPRASVINVNVANPGIAIDAAARNGRIIEARRTMNRLKRSGGDPAARMSPEMVERIERIGQRFADSLAEVMPDQAHDDKWKCGTSSGGHDFEYSVSNEEFHMVTRTKFEGCSTLHALVGLCEYDLAPAYNSEIQSASCLSASRNATDSVWRVFKQEHPTSVVEDNILQVSAVDALKESKFGGLWVSVYTPDLQGRTEVAGVQVPPTKAGHVRVGLLRHTYRIAPLKAMADNGFVLTYSLVSRPSPSVCAQLAALPAKKLKGMIQSAVDGFPSKFRSHIASEAVHIRALEASRDSFYSAVHLQLTGVRGLELPAVSLKLPPGGMKKDHQSQLPRMAPLVEEEKSSLDKAAAAEDTDTRVPVQSAYHDSLEKLVPRVPSLEQISHEMPSHWADS